MKISLKHFFNFGFIFEVIVFTFAMLLSIGIALRLLAKTVIVHPEVQIVSSKGYQAWEFILLFAVATVILLLILKYFKKAWLIQLIFYIAILEGLWLFGQAYFSWPYDLAFMLIIVFFWLIYKNVLIHDLVIVLAISAIAVVFGLNLYPSTAIIILLFLAVYDFWAVYKTKHMIRMFRSLAKSKVHFSLIIPQFFSGLLKKLETVKPQTEFMFLGTGDLAIPAIFVVSTMKISVLTSVITALGAVLGLVLLYIIFITQTKKQPMPGLPPIVLGCLLGFLVSFIFI